MSGAAAEAVSPWTVIASRLKAHGIHTAFGLPGDDMTIIDSFIRHGISTQLVHDQRNAGYQAVAYAKVSGSVSVCFVGKGPAVTHVITAILEARATCAPMVLLTSGVPENAIGSRAFQELDSLIALKPFIKWSRRLGDPEALVSDIDEAIHEALSGVPGPVCIEVPEGLTLSGDFDDPASPCERQAVATANVAVPRSLEASSRAVILVGGGAKLSKSGVLIEEFASITGAAILCTASGRGAVSETHSQFVGLSGLYARPASQKLLASADLIITLGSRLEETATFGWPRGLKMIQVNIDRAEIAPDWVAEAVIGDVSATLESWIALHSPEAVELDRHTWRQEIESVRDELHAEARAELERTDVGTPRVSEVLRAVDQVVPRNRISVHENGLQDIWSYFSPDWILREEADCLVPSEQTPLGFGMAGALGAAVAAPGRPVVVIGGDGAFVVASPELGSYAQLRQPVLIVVLSNGGYGWLEMNLRQYVPPIPASKITFVSSMSPISGLCAAYGLPHRVCRSSDDLTDAVAECWEISSAGVVSVLEVFVSLGDVPPGMSHLDGDFPVSQAMTQGVM